MKNFFKRFLASSALLLIVGSMLVLPIAAFADTTDPPPTDPPPADPATPAANTEPAAESGSDIPAFVPLTSIPIFGDIGSSDNLASFLNGVYRISIGAAAVLAVIQITRAGITYMLGDSVTEKREARHLLAMSFFGLLLVLSPTIVFGIIDPRILSLDINTANLQTGNLGPNATGFQSPAAGDGPSAGGPAIAPNGQVEALSLGPNDCRADLRAAGFAGLSGIGVPAAGVALEFMGKDNVEVGRVCCARYDGTVQSSPAPERCMLSSLYNNDRYEMTLLADAKIRKQETTGGIPSTVEKDVRLTVRTPGAGSASGGNMIAQYGFRSMAACTSAAATADSLESHIRGHQNVVEGYVRMSVQGATLEIGDLVDITGDIDGIGGAKCRKVEYVPQN